MAESRAADYIAIGASRGAENFLAGLEKRRDEEKREAKEFKSLADFAEASGLLSRDQAMVMDKDSLKGFVQGKMWAAENTRQNQQAALEQFMAVQKLRTDSAMTQFGQDYSNNMAMGYAPNLADFYENPEAYGHQQPQADQLAAFQNAVTRNPMAVADERFGTFNSAMHAMQPKQYAPTDVEQLMGLEDRLKSAGQKDRASVVNAIIEAKKHPAREDRFDLDYSNQLKLQNELAFLQEEFTNPLLMSDAEKEAKTKKITMRALYQQKLDAIDEKYKKLVRKSKAPEVPTPAPVPEEKKATSEPVKITTQADFDALPEGATFINPADGKVYTKKTKK